MRTTLLGFAIACAIMIACMFSYEPAKVPRVRSVPTNDGTSFYRLAPTDTVKIDTPCTM